MIKENENGKEEKKESRKKEKQTNGRTRVIKGRETFGGVTATITLSPSDGC